MEKVEEGYLEELEVSDVTTDAAKDAKRKAPKDDEELRAKVPKI